MTTLIQRVEANKAMAETTAHAGCKRFHVRAFMEAFEPGYKKLEALIAAVVCDCSGCRLKYGGTS